MQSSQTGAKKALTFVASIALAFGGTIGFAGSANAATPLVLTYESDDAAGAKVLNACGGATWECAFSGTVAAIVDAPAGGGTGKGLEITKAGDLWSGLNLLQADSGSQLASESSAVVTMDFYSPDSAKSPVEFQLIPTSGATISAAAEVSPGWNSVSIDMSTAPGYSASATYTKAVLFPDFVNMGDVPGYTGAAAVAVAGQKYVIDNVTFVGAGVIPAPAGPPAATSTLLTFESADTLGATATAGAFSGTTVTIGDAPAGGNGGKALLVAKAGDAWSGVNVVTAPAGVKFLDATHTSITLDYFSPDSVNSPVQINVTNTDGGAIKQAVQAVPGWQKLTFDFSGSYMDSKTYNLITLFPDFVNMGDVPGYTGAAAAAISGQVYAIDNIGINGATTPGIPVPKTAPALLVTYESGDVTGPKAAIDCGANPPGWACAFEGAVATVSAAPAGGNGGNALKIVKSGQPWAGVNWIEAPANTILADSNHHNVTLNYFSPDSAKSPVEVQLIPESGATISQAVEASPGWQTLTFDMSTAVGYSASANYVKAVIFPDFVNAGDVPGYHGATAVAVSGQAYYVDNVGFVGATTPAIPVAPATVAPSNSKAAAISGTAKVGKSLTVAKGTWSGTPAPAFTYKWYRCTVAGNATAAAPAASAKCVAIAKATATTYKLVAADKGKYIRALVTAKNSKGTKYSLTKAVGKVG